MCTEGHHIGFCIVCIPGMTFMFVWLKLSILWEPCIRKISMSEVLSHDHRHLPDICFTDGTVQDFIIQKASVYYLIHGIECVRVWVWVPSARWRCPHLSVLLCGNPTSPQKAWMIHSSRDHSADSLGVCGHLICSRGNLSLGTDLVSASLRVGLFSCFSFSWQRNPWHSCFLFFPPV